MLYEKSSSIRLIITILLAVLGILRTEAAVACNLVPNGRLEQGGPTTFDNWQFKVFNGQGTVSVSEYPNEVQSGSRAATVTITQPGDINLRTWPEPSSIAVEPSTTYVLSARLKSTASAGLRIAEYSSGSVVKGTFLVNGGGSNAWETLEATFTTQPSTDHLAIRLVHHISAGTFTWDDISLWKHEAGKRCVDVRHYYHQSTPGFRLCNSTSNQAICVDGRKLSSQEFLYEYSHGIRDFYTHNGTGLETNPSVGVHKNLDTGVWRCFADPGDDCGNFDGSNASYPPHTLALSMMLPVVTTGPATTTVTPGAQMTNDWERFDVRTIDPLTGNQSGAAPLWNRRWALVLDSYDFGGDIGVQENILVLEQEGTSVQPFGFLGGERLERYLFGQGFNRLKTNGQEDPDCRANPNSSNCDGNYSQLTSINTWSDRRTGDFTFELDLPWIETDWW